MSRVHVPALHRRRRSAASRALLIGALVLAGSACSASGGGTEAVSSGPGAVPAAGVRYLNQAAAATNEATTLGFSVETSVTGLSGVGDLANSASGEIDRERHRAHTLAERPTPQDLHVFADERSLT